MLVSWALGGRIKKSSVYFRGNIVPLDVSRARDQEY